MDRMKAQSIVRRLYVKCVRIAFAQTLLLLFAAAWLLASYRQHHSLATAAVVITLLTAFTLRRCWVDWLYDRDLSMHELKRLPGLRRKLKRVIRTLCIKNKLSRPVAVISDEERGVNGWLRFNPLHQYVVIVHPTIVRSYSRTELEALVAHELAHMSWMNYVESVLLHGEKLLSRAYLWLGAHFLLSGLYNGRPDVSDIWLQGLGVFALVRTILAVLRMKVSQCSEFIADTRAVLFTGKLNPAIRLRQRELDRISAIPLRCSRPEVWLYNCLTTFRIYLWSTHPFTISRIENLKSLRV